MSHCLYSHTCDRHRAGISLRSLAGVISHHCLRCPYLEAHELLLNPRFIKLAQCVMLLRPRSTTRRRRLNPST